MKTKELKRELRKIFPKLYHIWFTDSEYSILKLTDLREILKDVSVKDFRFRSNVWDCDNFALQLHARIQKYQYDLIQLSEVKNHKSWAFGEVIGMKFRGEQKNHTANICMTDSGLMLIEPQNNKIWKAKQGDDFVYFVKF